MRRWAISMCGVLPLVMFLLGCASVEAPRASPPLASADALPSFEDSNAALLDRTLAGVRIGDLVSAVTKMTEKTVVVSMEDTVSRSVSNYNYLVEDKLIASMLSSGLTVLERDENLIVRAVPEGADTYNRALLRNLPSPPTVVLLDAIERNGLQSLLKDEKLTLSEILSFYKQVNDDYRALLEAQDHLLSADVIVSYRLLELGVRTTTSKVVAPNQVAGSDTTLWAWQVSRQALARMFIRVLDAKTGQIRAARILENSGDKKTVLAQNIGEGEADFNARVDAYIAALADYHYSWYEQQLPNKNGNPEPKGGGTLLPSAPPSPKGLFQ